MKRCECFGCCIKPPRKSFIEHQLMPWAFKPREDGLRKALATWVRAQVCIRLLRLEYR